MEGRPVAPSSARHPLALATVVALLALVGCQRSTDGLPTLPTESPAAATTDHVGPTGTPQAGPSPAVAGDPLPRASVQVTQVSGLRDDASGEVSLNPAKVLPAAQRPAVVPGPVTARLLADDGSVLAEGTGELSAFSDGATSNFTIFLDTPAVPAASLEVTIDGEVVATTTGSGVVPRVIITQPDTGSAQPGSPVAVAWEPAAPAGTELVYAVYATADGRSWRSVVGETRDVSATVPADLVAEVAVGAARIVVTVSDGVNGSATAVQPFG